MAPVASAVRAGEPLANSSSDLGSGVKAEQGRRQRLVPANDRRGAAIMLLSVQSA